MDKHQDEAFERWMDSELTGRPEAADAAFAALFQTLPLADPPANFAAAVLARAGLVRQPSPRWSWAQKAALIACLILVGLAATFVPGVVMTLADPLQPLTAIEWAASGLLGAVHWFANGMSVWGALADAGHGVRVAFSTPPLLAAVAMALLLSVTAFRLLHGLVTADRRRTHYAE